MNRLKALPYLIGAMLVLCLVAGAWWHLNERLKLVLTFGRLKSLQRDLDDFRSAKGAFPESSSQLPADSRDPVDAWERPIFYLRMGDGYLIASFGRDGKEDRSYDWTALHQLVAKENNPPRSGPFRGVDCGDLDIDQIATEAGWYRYCGK